MLRNILSPTVIAMLAAAPWATASDPFPCEVYDDGSSEAGIGTGSVNGDVLWIHKAGVVGESAEIVGISTAWGCAASPGNAPPNGSPSRVGLWKDPNDDGDPNDAVLLAEVATTVANVDTDVFQFVPLPVSVTVSGIYFCGASTGGPLPAPLDTSTASLGRAWLVKNAASSIAYTNLAAADFPPVDQDTITPGVWLMSCVCIKCLCVSPMVGECFPGTGGVIQCPCGQPANSSGGCANFGTGATSGAVLSASGVADLSSDTLKLTTSNQRSPAFGVLNVFFSYKPGSTTPTTGIPNGAGVRCIGSGGSLARLYTVQVFGGTITKPGMSDPSVSARSAAVAGHAIVPPETRHYFNVYRDGQAAGPCGNTAISTNLTNMGAVSWVP